MVSPKKDSTRKRPSAENQGTELLGFKAKINKLLLPYSNFKSDSSKRKKKKKKPSVVSWPCGTSSNPSRNRNLAVRTAPRVEPLPSCWARSLLTSHPQAPATRRAPASQWGRAGLRSGTCFRAPNLRTVILGH